VLQTTKLIKTVCFADLAIFLIYLIQIYFESKYSKNNKTFFGFKYWRIWIHKIRYSIICIPNKYSHNIQWKWSQ